MARTFSSRVVRFFGGRNALGVGKTPVWTGAPTSLIIAPGGSVNFGQYASDPQNDPLSFSLVGVVPAGYSINRLTGVVSTSSGIVDAPLTIRASNRQFYSDHSCSFSPAVANRAPVWTGAPASISRSVGQSILFGPYASDLDGDPLSFSLPGNPANYIVNSLTGEVTIFPGALSTALSIQIRDPSGLTATHVCNVTITAALSATFAISVSGSTVTTRKVSSGQTWTGATIDGSTIGAGPGSIIEFQSGTYPATFNMNNFRGTATNKIVFRVQSGGLVILSTQDTSFRWRWTNCQHVTIDGATTNANAVYPIVHLPAPYRCGFRMNGAGACTAWLKFKNTTHLPKGITVQYLEIYGSQKGGICFDLNDNQGSRMADYPNQYVEDTTLRYSYFHGAGGCYLGSNYEADEVGGLEIPFRRTTVEYCRIVDTDQECCTFKKHWQGPNYIRYNWFENSGRNQTNVPQRGITQLQNATVIIHDNFYLFSARGQSGIAQAGEHGIGAQSLNGPDISGVPSAGTGVPSSAYNQYGTFPYFEVEIFNNVIVDSAEDGISQSTLTISPNKAPGVTTLPKQLMKVYSNIICTNGNNGIRLVTPQTGSFVRNNIVLGNSQSELASVAATLGAGVNTISGETVSSLFVNPTAALYTNRDYHLKKAVAVASGSTLGTNVANTDLDGNPRTLANADKGAYEYP